jgi:predicted transcriptional regulator
MEVRLLEKHPFQLNSLKMNTLDRGERAERIVEMIQSDNNGLDITKLLSKNNL